MPKIEPKEIDIFPCGHIRAEMPGYIWAAYPWRSIVCDKCYQEEKKEREKIK